jgi:hypothetical protein
MATNRDSELKRLRSEGLIGRNDLVWMTPDKAADWLTRNTINRTVRERRVRYWMSVLTQGHWVPASCQFHVDAHHNLLNGQHRLYAIQRSGVSVWISVVFDLNPKVYQALDQGGAMRAGQDLLDNDETNRKGKSAIISNLHRIECNSAAVNAPNPYRFEAMRRSYESHIDWAIENITIRRGHIACPAHVAAPLAFCHSSKGLIVPVEEFVENLVESTGRVTGCPAIALERAINFDKQGGQSRSVTWATLLKTFRAIQFHCEGKKIAKLQSTDEGIFWAYKQVGYKPPPGVVIQGELVLESSAAKA